MAVPFNDNIGISAPKAVDSRSVKFVAGVSTPFASVAEAHAAQTFKSIGVPIYINVGGQIVEYQYDGQGLAQSNLVPKVVLASQIAAGTIDDSRLSANIVSVAKATTQTFTGGIAAPSAALTNLTVNSQLGTGTRMATFDASGNIGSSALPPSYFSSSQFTGTGASSGSPLTINTTNLFSAGAIPVTALNATGGSSTSVLRKDGTWGNAPLVDTYFSTQFSGSGASSGDPISIANNSIAVSNISATGTPSSTTYLRGDGQWATLAGGGSGDVTAGGNNVFTGANTFSGDSTFGNLAVTTGGLSINRNGSEYAFATIGDAPSLFSGQVNINADVVIGTVGKGFVVKSPDGTKYRITAANDGTLTTTVVP